MIAVIPEFFAHSSMAREGLRETHTTLWFP